MPGGADAGDADRGLVRIGLQPGDQPLQIVSRKGLLADDQQRLGADQDHRFQIPEQVELQRIEPAGQHMRGRGADRERVAVGGRAHRTADAEGARGARRHSRSRRVVRGSGASARRGSAPDRRWRLRRKRHDHGDRARRIGLARRPAAPVQGPAGSRATVSVLRMLPPNHCFRRNMYARGRRQAGRECGLGLLG